MPGFDPVAVTAPRCATNELHTVQVYITKKIINEHFLNIFLFSHSGQNCFGSVQGDHIIFSNLF